MYVKPGESEKYNSRDTWVRFGIIDNEIGPVDPFHIFWLHSLNCKIKRLVAKIRLSSDRRHRWSANVPGQNASIFIITSFVIVVVVAIVPPDVTLKWFQISASTKQKSAFYYLKSSLSSVLVAYRYPHFWQPKCPSYFLGFHVHFELQTQHIGQETNYLEYQHF